MIFSRKYNIHLVLITFYILFSSCQKNSVPITNYNENSNYFELNIGTKKYDVIIPFGKTFDAVNFYS